MHPCCRATVLFVCLFGLCRGAKAQEGPFGSPGERDARFWASLKGALYEAKTVEGAPKGAQAGAPAEPETASMSLVEARLGFPLWRGSMEGVSFSTEFKHRRMDLEWTLPGTDDRLPHDLYRQEFEAGYWRVNRKGRFFLASAQIGTDSDVPYASFEEMDTRLFAAYMIPVRDRRDAWMLGLDWSANRTFLNYVPLPGVGYRWRPNDALQIVAGIPFLNASWTPEGPWSASLSGSPSPSVSARLSFELTEEVDVFAAYRWLTEAYFRADREEEEDRLFYTEQVLEAGFAAVPFEAFRLEAALGLSAVRSLFESDGFYDGWQEDALDLEDALFFRLGASFTVPSAKGRPGEKGPPRGGAPQGRPSQGAPARGGPPSRQVR